MKNALLKNTLRQMWKTKNRFLSILAIIALGCGFFAGVKATCPDMKYTVQRYFEENKLMDIHLISTLGFDEDDMSALRSANGVDKASPGYSADLFANASGESDIVVKAYSLDLALVGSDSEDYINRPILKEGRFPQNAQECVVEVNAKTPNNFAIGNQIKFSTNDDEHPLSDILNGDTYTVVGIVQSPMYISFERGNSQIGNGVVAAFCMLPNEAFAYKGYTDMYITLQNTQGLAPYEQQYQDLVHGKKAELEELSKTRLPLRAQTALSDEIRELDEAKADYEDGFKKYSDSEDQYRSEIASAQKKINTAQNLMSKNEAASRDGLSQYQQAQSQYETKAAQLAQLEAIMGQTPEVQAGYSQLSAAKAQLDATKQQLDSAQEQIDSAKVELASAKRELEKQKVNGQQRLDDAKIELADAQVKIADNEQKLSDAIDNAKWYVLDRDDNVDYTSYGENADRVDAIAKVFPVFFILVAALVCLTTMTRMVEEQRTQIGTLKALGYKPGAIAAQYFIYAIAASILGGFLGLGVGLHLFPKVIVNAYGILYNTPGAITPFKWDYAFWCILVAILCTGLSALAACYKELIAQPAQLMRPKPPKSGKRVWMERTPLWKHLSFTKKVTVRNLLRYKGRILMTVVGIAGCTALMLAGFGLQHAISSIVDKQYGDIMTYDVIMLVDENASPQEVLNVQTALDESDLVSGSISAMQKSQRVSANHKSKDATVFVPRDIKSLSEYVHLKERQSGKPLTLSNEGVVINEKLSTLLDISVGDTITVGELEQQREFVVSGVTENYAFNYVYISPELYERAYGKPPVYNNFIANMTDESQRDALSGEMLEHNAVLGLSYSSLSEQHFKDIMKSLDYIVYVIIFSAGALAFVVLYNLTNINVNERIRELATIKVLGFYDIEVSEYVYRENLISTLIGVMIGLFGGVFLTNFVVQTAEVDMVMFSPDIAPWCFVCAALLTIVFTFIVNFVLHFRLKKIDMAASLAAVE